MKRILIAAVACALATPALAGEAGERRIVIETHDLLAQAADTKAAAFTWEQWGDDLRASLGTMFGDHFAAAKVVKGAPYSAEVTTEVNQALADGNVIAKRTTGRVYRDGEGRTRQETVVDGAVRSIQLRDPVAGTSVMLLPSSKKVVRLPKVDFDTDFKDVKVLRVGEREIRIENGKVSVDGKPASGTVELKAGGKEIRVENGKVTIDGKEMVPGEGGRKVVVRRVDQVEPGDGTQREEVRIHVFRASGDGEAVAIAPPAPPATPRAPRVAPVAPVPPLPPLPPMPSVLDGATLKAKATTTSLGVKEFDGVRAEGKSTVRTIPAGEIGNRNPILITSESWRSPELQVTVYSRHSDPRHGETVYRLTNIRRGEPAADLFRVPEDYKGSRRERG
jgi:hypothetical protein